MTNNNALLIYQRNKLAVILFIACGSFILGACKKSTSSATITATKANITGLYKLTGYTEKIGSGPTANMYDSFPSCEKDDMVRFNSDLSYDYIDTGSVCNPSGDMSGNWSLPNSSTLFMDGTNYTIKSFTGSSLVITYSLTDSSYTPYVTNFFTVTLTK